MKNWLLNINWIRYSFLYVELYDILPINHSKFNSCNNLNIFQWYWAPTTTWNTEIFVLFNRVWIDDLLRAIHLGTQYHSKIYLLLVKFRTGMLHIERIEKQPRQVDLRWLWGIDRRVPYLKDKFLLPSPQFSLSIFGQHHSSHWC